ncbi:MAG: hypothetical protein GXO23_01545 [Crenarchaeota archaeon]|nr:hypothetical protein [Thermoproteota archaeon]
MNILLLYCSEREKKVAESISRELLRECPNIVPELAKITSINRISLHDYDHVIAIMPLPILIRKICHKLVDKLRDPSVTLVSPDMRYIIPICGEHSRLGIDVANMLCNILKGRVISTCSSPYYRCLEYVIAKLKLIIRSDDIERFRRIFLKNDMYRIYVDGCLKVGKIISMFFDGFKVTSSIGPSDFVITMYRDGTYSVPVLYYPLLELEVSQYSYSLLYVLYRACQCLFTVPDRIDIVSLSSQVSDFCLRQYFIS